MGSKEVTIRKEDGIVKVTSRGRITLADSKSIITEIQTLLDTSREPLLLVDLTNMSPHSFPSDSLTGLSSNIRAMRAIRQAVVISNPVLKSFASIIIRLAGLSHPVRFFRNVPDAEAWLRAGVTLPPLRFAGGSGRDES